MLRFLKRLAIILFVLAIGVVALLWYIGRTPPAWYAPPDPADQLVAAVADRVEYGVVEQTQKARPTDEPWAMRIEEAQINAWLSARLRAWVAHDRGARWPEQLGTPQVRLDTGRLSLALPLDGAGGTRVVVAEVAPHIQGDSLWFHLEGLRMGRIALPGDPVESLAGLVKRFAGDDDERITRVVNLLTAREPIEPLMELADGRRVRVIDLTCRKAAIDVTCRTLSARGATIRETDSNQPE